MKAIDGKLRIDQKYKLVTVQYKPKGDDFFDISFCENCGKMICNIAIVQDENEKKYQIGIDCAATLTSIEPSKIKQAQKELRNKAKMFKFLKLECKYILVNQNNMFWAYKNKVEKWQHYWIWRGKFELIKEYVKHLGIEFSYIQD